MNEAQLATGSHIAAQSPDLATHFEASRKDQDESTSSSNPRQTLVEPMSVELQNGSPLCHIFSTLNLATWTGIHPLFPRRVLQARVVTIICSSFAAGSPWAIKRLVASTWTLSCGLLLLLRLSRFALLKVSRYRQAR